MYFFSIKINLYSIKCAFIISKLIAYTKKYLQSDWLRGVQHWSYLYSFFNICILLLNKKKKKKYNIRIP